MTDSVSKVKLLNNSNYPEWAGDMKAVLMPMGCWRLVSGKEVRPNEMSDSDGAERWDAKAERAAGEIYLSVEPDQKTHGRGIDGDPVKMWKALQEAHLQKKPGACFNAYDQLFGIRKGDDETLMEMSTRIEKAMATIHNLRPDNFTVEQLDEELQCMAMIRALPDDYQNLSSVLLLSDTLSKEKIQQAFRSEELNRERRNEVANRAKQATPGTSANTSTSGKSVNTFNQKNSTTTTKRTLLLL